MLEPVTEEIIPIPQHQLQRVRANNNRSAREAFAETFYSPQVYNNIGTMDLNIKVGVATSILLGDFMEGGVHLTLQSLQLSLVIVGFPRFFFNEVECVLLSSVHHERKWYQDPISHSESERIDNSAFEYDLGYDVEDHQKAGSPNDTPNPVQRGSPGWEALWSLSTDIPSFRPRFDQISYARNLQLTLVILSVFYTADCIAVVPEKLYLVARAVSYSGELAKAGVLGVKECVSRFVGSQVLGGHVLSIAIEDVYFVSWWIRNPEFPCKTISLYMKNPCDDKDKQGRVR
nr:unnamed protein product [Callosobruchus chinensis]